MILDRHDDLRSGRDRALDEPIGIIHDQMDRHGVPFSVLGLVRS
jgi:hypothetical protein